MGRRTPKETGSDEFGERLRSLRKAHGWTQAEFAEKVSIDRSMIGNYEAGLHYPPIPTLVKLARVLEISVDRLLGVEENKVDDLQDRRLYKLFLAADRADLSKQSLVKQVLEGLLTIEMIHGHGKLAGTTG